MSSDPGWRHERVAARDAALRRISWWTVALAAGSLGGTAVVSTVVQADAEARAAAKTALVAQIPADDGTTDDGTEASPAESTTAPSSRSHVTARSSDNSRSTRRTALRPTSTHHRAVTPTQTQAQTQAPKKKKTAQPVVTSAGS